MFENLHRRQSLKSLAMGTASVLGGTAAAVVRGNAEVLPAILCLFFAIFAQLSAYFSLRHRELEQARIRASLSAEIKEFVEHTREQAIISFKDIATAMFIIALTIALTLVAMAGWWSALFGVLVFVIAYATNAGKYPLGRSPLAGISTFLLFGPIGVIGTCLIQSAHEADTMLNWYDLAPALYLSVCVGCLAVNCNIAARQLTYDSDKANGIKTLTVALGIPATRGIFMLNGLVMCAASIALCYNFHFDNWGYDTIIPAAALVANTIIGVMMGGKAADGKRRDMRPWCYLNIIFYTLGALVIFYFIGVPDDSATTFF